MSGMNRRWVSAAAAIVASATAAQAGATSPKCGNVSKTEWNVPDGGLMVERTGGHIKVVMDAINEWGTHVVLSNGGGWATQSTALDPTTNDKSCSVPINRTSLSDAGPGGENITVQGLYLFLYNGSDIGSTALATRNATGPNVNGIIGMEWYSGNNPDDDQGYYPDDQSGNVLFPGGSNRGAQIADFEWNWNNYSYDPTDNVYRMQSDDGNYMRYGYHQYMDMGNVYTGNDDQYVGVVCSTLHAWASWRSGAGGVVPVGRYPASEKINAMNGLYGNVVDTCNSRTNWFLTGAWCFGKDPCARAGNEVLNQFAIDSPSTEDRYWRAVRDDSSQLPYTISPDCLAGYSAQCPWNGPGASAWGWDLPRPVTWSGPTSYGCWD